MPEPVYNDGNPSGIKPHLASRRYFETARRYNYTTPKSYLELISLYKLLLAKQRATLAENKTRLENGVEKIAQASRQVADLQVRAHS